MTYNQEKYIRDCLQGIVDQKTDFLFEVIVADDCSTDGTRAIVQEFAQRYPRTVKPLFRACNVGTTKNFIEMHNAANATYVAHMDGDDLMLPGKLQKQVDFLDANPDFSVVWHRVNLFDDNGGFYSGENFDISFFPNGVVTLEHALRLGSVAAHCSMMYRRSARKTRQADFEILDLFYTWEYLSSGKGKILNEVLGSYRVSAQGSMQVKSIPKILRLIAHHARYYLHLLPEQRRNIFVYTLLAFLAHLKRLRSCGWAFGKVAIESASIVSPWLLLRTSREMSRLPPCSPLGAALLTYSRKE